MLSKNELAPWLKSVMLFGYESEGEEGGVAGEGAGEGAAGEGTEGEGGESGEDELANMRKALAAERLRSKNLAKENKTLKGAKGAAATEEGEGEGEEIATDKGKVANERLLKRANSESQAKLEKLSAGFRTAELKSTVREIAGGLNFVDWEDALNALDIKLLNYEQDDDDPSIVVWDESEIKTALKDLAKRKPHFLKQGDGKTGAGKTPNRPSGSKFGGAGKPSTTEAKAQLDGLRARFPAMRQVRPPQG